jgi:hypothetical protein
MRLRRDEHARPQRLDQALPVTNTPGTPPTRGATRAIDMPPTRNRLQNRSTTRRGDQLISYSRNRVRTARNSPTAVSRPRQFEGSRTEPL